MSEPLSRPRALLVEDEGMTILLLRRALTAAGYEIAHAVPDGEQAVLAAKELQPDFILMDINLPRMSGIEATRQITQQRPVPVIMLTAYSDQKCVDEAIAAGACAYLVKPVIAEQIAPAVRAALARFAALRAVQHEADTLREALEGRKLIERAKGILMERLQLTEAEAFQRLQKTARDRSLPAKQVAQELIQADQLLRQG